MSATLGAVVREAMTLWDQLKQNGASLEDRQQGLETVLRAQWPRGRPWQYLCEACDDAGLQVRECPGDASCGRPRPHGGHAYGVPCFCAKGTKFQEPKATSDDFAAAGKVAKSFTRAGRG